MKNIFIEIESLLNERNIKGITESQIAYLSDFKKNRYDEWREWARSFDKYAVFELNFKISQFEGNEAHKLFLKKTPEEQRQYKLGIDRWASTRWNDGNYSLDFEYEEMMRFINEGKGLLSEVRRNRISQNLVNEEFFFFDEINSPFSNYFKSNFTIKGKTYHSVMQLMMIEKANTFYDDDVREKVMKEEDPKKCYKLGLKVRDFQKGVWKNLYSGNNLKLAIQEKFKQNEEIKEHLFSTQGKTIVLACKDEPYWGIGMNRNDKGVLQRLEWNGKNILGDLLTDVRCELMGEY